jgi:hypothetical protein
MERPVQQPQQCWCPRKEIGKCVIVEDVEEPALRAQQCTLESAGAVDRAGVPGGVEAFDQVPARLGTSNDPAHIDLGGRLVQAQAAVSPADAGNQAVRHQQLHHFDHDVR